jgi:hypothetical protein
MTAFDKVLAELLTAHKTINSLDKQLVDLHDKLDAERAECTRIRGNVSEFNPENLRELLTGTNRILKIKLIRSWFGMGLKEAKEFVDATIPNNNPDGRLV